MDKLTIKETMSSLQIAEISGRRHTDVLRSIREMESAWEKISQRKFASATYRDEQGKSRPCYELTKTECLYIATKFNDEVRAKLVIRWEELERANQDVTRTLPQNYKEALLALVHEVEEKEALQAQIKTEAPKVAFANAIITSSTSCLIGELAKLITQNGVSIGQNRLFEWLRENGYLGKKGERYNIPNQQYIEQGLFELKKGVRSGNDGVIHTTITPKVTGKGQAYFINKFLYNEEQTQKGGK